MRFKMTSSERARFIAIARSRGIIRTDAAFHAAIDLAEKQLDDAVKSGRLTPSARHFNSADVMRVFPPTGNDWPLP